MGLDAEDMTMTTTTYTVRGSNIITSSQGHATLEDACMAIERQRSGLVAVPWPDGSVGYYRDDDDAERDPTGEHAIALATQDDGE